LQADRLFKLSTPFIGKSARAAFLLGSFDLAVTRFFSAAAPLHQAAFPIFGSARARAYSMR
jgi:hypothetical protein